MIRMPKLNGLVQADPSKLTLENINQLKEQLESTMDLRFEGLKELLDERFRHVDTELIMRDIALKAALEAAASADKQRNESSTLAIDKAGAAFAKQVDGLDGKINDLKERVTVMEAKTTGITAATLEHRQSNIDFRGMVFGISGVVLAIITLIIGYFRSLQHVVQ